MEHLHDFLVENLKLVTEKTFEIYGNLSLVFLDEFGSKISASIEKSREKNQILSQGLEESLLTSKLTTNRF